MNMHSMIECAIWYRFLLQLYYLLFYTYARYFVFYFNNTAFTWIYSEQYDLTPSNFSLAYLVFPTGCVVGSLLGGRLSDRAYKRKTFAARNNIEANANTKEPNFEMRLGIGMLGTCFLYGLDAYQCLDGVFRKSCTLRTESLANLQASTR